MNRLCRSLGAALVVGAVAAAGFGQAQPAAAQQQQERELTADEQQWVAGKALGVGQVLIDPDRSNEKEVAAALVLVERCLTYELSKDGNRDRAETVCGRRLGAVLDLTRYMHDPVAHKVERDLSPEEEGQVGAMSGKVRDGVMLANRGNEREANAVGSLLAGCMFAHLKSGLEWSDAQELCLGHLDEAIKAVREFAGM